MIDTADFGQQLREYGFSFFSGVPCSFLKNLINYAVNDCQFVMAANEGDAVASCAGAHLGGKKAVFLCQNSGLTNATSPLTSLNYTFKIPVLGFVSLRGEPGLSDEPQHELMGQITESLLTTMRVESQVLSQDPGEALIQLRHAAQVYERGETFFFIVRKGTFSDQPLRNRPEPVSVQPFYRGLTGVPTRPSRLAALQTLVEQRRPEDVFLATTGKTGRELYEIEDADRHLYMVGSMGCVSSLGLGLALARPDLNVIVIDGDGSLVMRMGNLATNGFYQPKNLCHLVLDNRCHDSTGGQFTTSASLNIPGLAHNAGYARALALADIDQLRDSLDEWRRDPLLTMLHLTIAPGSKEDLGRPKVKPFEVARRLMGSL